MVSEELGDAVVDKARGKSLAAHEDGRIVIHRQRHSIPETLLEARDAEHTVIAAARGAELGDGRFDRFGRQQRVGAVRLEVEIRLHLRRVMEQDVVHGDVVGAEALGAGDQLHGREEAAHAFHHRFGVGVHHHRLDLRDGEQGLEDVVKERLARQQTVVFARHALAMVTHRNKGGEFHGGDYTELAPEKEMVTLPVTISQ